MKSVVEERGQPAGISGVLLVATKLDVNRQRGTVTGGV